MDRSNDAPSGGDDGHPDSQATTPLQGPNRAAAVLPTRWGHLENLQLLGAGSFGWVFKAWDPPLQRHVALKLENRTTTVTADWDSQVSQFLSEGRRLARVRHPHLVTVFGAEQHDGRAGIWMELLDGATLRELVDRNGPFGDREAANIVADVCRALCAIHQAGIVHHDVSAANVMRETGGRIVLMDLGLSTDSLDSRVDLPQQIAGTPSFIAPEVLLGEPATALSDVFSAGVLFFYLLSGKFPFTATNLADMVRLHREGKYRLIHEFRPDVPAACAQILDRAMAARPSQRFQSAAEMETALAVFSNSLPAGTSVPPDAPGPRHPGPQRNVSRTALVVAGSLMLAATLAVGLEPPRRWLRSLIPGPAAASFRIAAAFYRNVGGELQPLHSGDRVTPGDAICLEVQSSDSLFVYVVNQDATSSTLWLFPSPGVLPGNPLPPGRHLLPGRVGSERVDWQVTSAGGTETYYVIGSRTRLLDMETELFSLPHPTADALANPGDDEYAGQTRGTGAFVRSAGAPRGGRLAKLLEAAKELPQAAELVQGPWTVRLHLDNPLRTP